jgi:hypothetical protein
MLWKRRCIVMVGFGILELQPQAKAYRSVPRVLRMNKRPINRAPIDRFLFKNWGVSYFNVSGYAAIPSHARPSDYCVVLLRRRLFGILVLEVRAVRPLAASGPSVNNLLVDRPRSLPRYLGR